MGSWKHFAFSLGMVLGPQVDLANKTAPKLCVYHETNPNPKRTTKGPAQNSGGERYITLSPGLEPSIGDLCKPIWQIVH